MMQKSVLSEKRVIILISISLVLLSIFVLTLSHSFSAPIDNDVEVREDSSLTYYLNVSYDGIDKDGTKSDNTTIEIHSDVLYVEDKLPEGLTFLNFVTTSNGTIGATKKENGKTCPGKVVDDTLEESTSDGSWNTSHTEYTYHGLHYNENTRTVSFKVQNLQAGCELTVGIKTKTPTSVDDSNTTTIEKRRDFYNFATIREKNLLLRSNMVHVFIGDSNLSLNSVKYEFVGEVPQPAPDLPEEMRYAPSTVVGVALSPQIDNYEFSGWTTEDVSVENEKFTMPTKNVVFRGSFSEKNKYTVTYVLDGIKPTNYVLPIEKEYHIGETVDLDNLKLGDTFDNYQFSGWITEDVEVSNNSFKMPNKNVTIRGSFEPKKYSVSYQFYSSDLPPNWESLLPPVKEYSYGDEVSLEEDPEEPEGYHFLGWYSDPTFEMPNENVVIYGEWKYVRGTFEPIIQKQIINQKDYYKIGDVVQFKITITNNADVDINNILVKDEGAIVTNENYKNLSNNLVKIDSIEAGQSKEVYSTYKVKVNDSNIVEKKAQLKGALANNNYELANKEYIASAAFTIESKLKICNSTSETTTSNVFRYKITGEDNQYETWIILEKNNCKTIFLEPAKYKVLEIIPQEYELEKVEGSMTQNNSEITIEQGITYEIRFTNRFRKKGFYHSFDRKNILIQQEGESS